MKLLLVVLLSSGWVIPLGMAAWLFVDFWHNEGWPILLGKHPGNSFDWLAPTKSLIFWGTLWLSAAVAFWSWNLWQLVQQCARPDSSSKPTPLRGKA